MAGPPVHTQYSLATEAISWLSIDLTQGLSDGDSSISDDPNDANGWSQKPNGVGGTVQSFNPGTNGTLTLTIDMEHPLHQTLKALSIVDQNLLSVVSTIIRKRSSGETILYHAARIMKQPAEKSGVTAGTCEWKWIYGSKTVSPAIPPANRIIPA